MTATPSNPAQSCQPSTDRAENVQDMLAEIYTWIREPDWTEEASLEWLMDWMNRRPIAAVAMVAMLMPDTPSVPSIHSAPRSEDQP